MSMPLILHIMYRYTLLVLNRGLYIYCIALAIVPSQALGKRLEMVQFLGASTKNSSGASDSWVGFLGKEKDLLTSHFEGAPLGKRLRVK